MLNDQQRIELATSIYGQHKRAKPWAVENDERTKRILGATHKYVAETNEPGDFVERFNKLVTEINDFLGLNLLTPNLEPPEPLELLKNPVTGETLQNPLRDPNKERGKRSMRILRRHYPKIADFFEKEYRDPVGLVHELRQKELKRQKLTAIYADYNTKVHKESNPLGGSNETDKTAFIKQFSATQPEIVEVYDAERKPVSIPLFGNPPEANRFFQTKLAKERPALWESVKGIGVHLKQMEADAVRREEEARAAAEARLAELRHKIDRPPTGQIITFAK